MVAEADLVACPNLLSACDDPLHPQVGDNPAADVRGANRAGPPWVSVLVRTGVFSGPPGSNSPKDPAQVTETVLLWSEVAHQAAGYKAQRVGGDQNGMVTLT